MHREWLNHQLKEETRTMRILALDLGKYKSLASQLRIQLEQRPELRAKASLRALGRQSP